MPTNKTFDPRNQPAYPLAEAARYLRLPIPTLRTWVLVREGKGQGASDRRARLIHLAQDAPPMLSFWNIIEAHVLRSLRRDHHVPLAEARRAVRYAERSLRIDRLFLHEQLRTEGGRLFLDEFGRLTDLSNSGQIALRAAFEGHLKRIEWASDKFPARFFPFVSDVSAEEPPVVIDPAIRFGRPILRRASVSTRVLVERLDAGEDIEDVARDYGITPDLVRTAALYEQAA